MSRRPARVFACTIGAVVAGALALVPLPAAAQAQAGTSPGKTEHSQPASMTDGEVKKVDADAGRLTIRHGDIKHMGMPGMTMVFTARNKGLLANLKPGDKIKFMVVDEGGKMIVTDIRPVR